MASAYFTLPSFAKAKKNKEQLEKTNPQDPVLNDNDQKWLEKQLQSVFKVAKGADKVPPSKITDDGEEKPATSKDQQQVGADVDQVVVPEKDEDTKSSTTSNQVTESNTTKKKSIQLPSQEEAEAATRNFNFNPSKSNDPKTQTEKKPWSSYLPSIGSSSKKPLTTDTPPSAPSATNPSTADDDDDVQRSWTEYATSYLPNSWQPKPNPKDKDSRLEPVLNPDGTINEAETAKKQENEIAVLLDNLNLSTINNRVFSFSDETRKYYERFAQCLRDTIDGVPTAYDDMEKLMREAGPTLEKQFKNMPPFVQTLVKSLPAKLSAALAPELLAAGSEKPGADLKAKIASEGSSSASAGLKVPQASGKAKKKRRVPGLKSLISQEGAAAGILKNVVSFLKVRFPFLASTTNVVMSLAVFILMFVFWYCHKRGKEVRLAKEADASRVQSEAEDNTAESSFDDEGDDDDDERDDAEKAAEGSSSASKKTDALNKPDPAQVPLPPSTSEVDLKSEKKI